MAGVRAGVRAGLHLHPPEVQMEVQMEVHPHISGGVTRHQPAYSGIGDGQSKEKKRYEQAS
jgi:hypothetical protein